MVCYIDALLSPNLSSLILLRAVLSKTIVASALRQSLLSVKTELYGYTTTSLVWSVLGKTEKVVEIFLGNLSLIFSIIKDPKPDPVPPAIECVKINPSKESLPSASLSIISKSSSSLL